ncbi:MAG: Signal transduction histidine kinase CheA [Labilithrix sp.]|nr:Signal transduction histidine kinase CheA [Labilithrix sp.]
MTLEQGSDRSWRRSWIATNSVVGFAYAAAGLLGDVSGLILFGKLTAFWPPAGIALYAMLYLDSRVWVGVWAGSFVSNIVAFYDPLSPVRSVVTNLAIGFGSASQAIVGSRLVRWACASRDPLERTSDVVKFILVALLSAVVSGLIGAVSMSVSVTIPWSDFVGFAWTWWLGDVTGILIVTPLLIVWLERPVPHNVSLIEAAALLGAVCVVSQIVFGTFGGPVHHYPLAHLFLPLLTWATLRFGAHGATLTTSVVYVLAMIGTGHGRGPYIATTDARSLFFLQAFLFDVTITVLTLSSLLTQRRLLFEERAARAEVQRLLRERDDFIAMASHELRTPLVPLKIHLDLLGRMMRGGLETAKSEMILKAVASSGRQVDRLSRLVEELLDVSRITAGRLVLNRESMSLSALVAEVVDRFRPELAKTGCTVEVEAPSPAEGDWDRSRLDQVVTNLLTNAMKYGPGKPIEIRIADEAETVSLSVTDHGIGIAPEQQAVVFDRFQRAASARHFHGLGLGLFITREIVIAHGGTIGVQSELGHGATFTVRLAKALGAGAVGP